MKKYIKPAIEELNLGATMPLMMSYGEGDEEGGTGYGEGAPGRKSKDYDDEGDFGEGW